MASSNTEGGDARLPMFTLTPLSGKQVGRERRIHVNLIGETSIANLVLGSVGFLGGMLVGSIFIVPFGTWGFAIMLTLGAAAATLLVARRRSGVQVRYSRHLIRQLNTRGDRGKIYYAGTLHDPAESLIVTIQPASMRYDDLPDAQKHHLDDLGDLGIIDRSREPAGRKEHRADWALHATRCSRWAESRNQELILAAFKANPFAFRGKDLPRAPHH